VRNGKRMGRRSGGDVGLVPVGWLDRRYNDGPGASASNEACLWLRCSLCVMCGCGGAVGDWCGLAVTAMSKQNASSVPCMHS